MAKRSPSTRITTRDVAQRAGVSQPTVSLVLSQNPTARIAPETRARIIKAAEELRYSPNLVARSLVRSRSYALGIIVPDFRNPFFADVVSSAERVAAEEGYAVLLCEAGESSPAKYLEALHARVIDGVIIDAVGASSVDAELLDRTNVVLIDQLPGRWPGVATDAQAAGQLAANLLIELGHRRIAFIGPAVDAHSFRMRERGFWKRLKDAGIDLPSEYLVRSNATAQEGRAAMRHLLSLDPRPTAVFCVNDIIAIGALKACASAKVSIPNEMSIVGCDDIELAQLVTPELTTVRVPARELGGRAARLLIRTIEGKSADKRMGKLLPVELILRGTTARAPGERQ
ncbi:MAG TPA: LacI family DNA-binding transcriptional regulator [Steroidobacteraceae bacterium]|nr:LacI family DNA-binding transcriptional regulator [Steroidobacteraceae bacterium]